MALLIRQYKGFNNNTATLVCSSLTINVGDTVGGIFFITGSTDATGHGTVADSSGSNIYTQRGTTFFRAGFGWTTECFTSVNVATSATSLTWTPPTVGTNFGMNAAIYILNPNTGTISYADVKQSDVTSTTTAAGGVQSAFFATTSVNPLITGMATDTGTGTLSPGAAMIADTPVPLAGIIPVHRFPTVSRPVLWTDNTAGNYAILAGLGFDWVAPDTLIGQICL